MNVDNCCVPTNTQIRPLGLGCVIEQLILRVNASGVPVKCILASKLNNHSTKALLKDLNTSFADF